MPETLTAEQVRAEREASLARRSVGGATPPVEPVQVEAETPKVAAADDKKAAEEAAIVTERKALQMAEIPFAALWPILQANRNNPLTHQIMDAVVFQLQQQKAYLLGKSDGMKEAVVIFERHAAKEAAKPTPADAPATPSESENRDA